MQRKSTKFRAPNAEQVPMSKVLNSKRNLFGHFELELGAYLDFGISDLEF
jgi:hypothetical protein